MPIVPRVRLPILARTFGTRHALMLTASAMMTTT